METVGAEMRCKHRIRGDKHGEAVAVSEFEQGSAEFVQPSRVTRSCDNHAAARQGTRRGKGVGQPVVVGHQHKRRQSARAQPGGHPCQLRA
jgi:hypothetical protein